MSLTFIATQAAQSSSDAPRSCGQLRRRVQHGGDQGGPAAQWRQAAQVLGGGTDPLLQRDGGVNPGMGKSAARN